MKNSQEEVKKFTILLEYSRFGTVINKNCFQSEEITASCIQRRDTDRKTIRHPTGRCCLPPKCLCWWHCPKQKDTGWVNKLKGSGLLEKPTSLGFEAVISPTKHTWFKTAQFLVTCFRLPRDSNTEGWHLSLNEYICTQHDYKCGSEHMKESDHL